MQKYIGDKNDKYLKHIYSLRYVSRHTMKKRLEDHGWKVELILRSDGAVMMNVRGFWFGGVCGVVLPRNSLDDHSNVLHDVYYTAGAFMSECQKWVGNC